MPYEPGPGLAAGGGTLSSTDWIRIVLTCLVPYCVATFAATNATLRMRRQER